MARARGLGQHPPAEPGGVRIGAGSGERPRPVPRRAVEVQLAQAARQPGAVGAAGSAAPLRPPPSVVGLGCWWGPSVGGGRESGPGDRRGNWAPLKGNAGRAPSVS